uniref:Tim44 domain-containing protein n=1 Tax=Steinernema glaseri TaxID=37863 RepID=A0A1I8ADJ9_9BILA
MSGRLSRYFMAAVLAFSTGALLTVSYDAEARRMGGGSSFGRQSSNITSNRSAATPPAAANNTTRSAAPAAGAAAAGTAAAGTAAKSGMSRFLGPIAGIAAGLGIAALLSSMGLGGAFLEMMSSLLLIGLVIFAVLFIVRRFRGSAARPAMQQAGAPPVDESWFIPGDFDTPTFLANAKTQFVEIQKLWDKGDVEQLRTFLTDDLLKEAAPQIAQRQGENVTQVVLLNAELLGIEKVADGHLASVRYSGMLREEAGAEAFRFEEVWNLFKADGAGWLLAGIQQIPVDPNA